MPDDVAPRGWSSHIHSSLAAYHKPANTQAASPGDIFTVQSRIHMARNSVPAAERLGSYSSYHSNSPSAPSAEGPIEQPITRRLMYDPVRDSVASSPNHTLPAVRPLESEDREAVPITHRERGVSHAGAGSTTIDARHPSHYEDDDSLIRAQIIRGSPQHQEYDSRATASDQGPQLGYVRSDWASFEVRRADSSAVHVSGADTEVGTGVELMKKYPTSRLRRSREASSSSSHKRSRAEIEDDVDYRYRKTMSREVNGSTFVDFKGKGKAVVSQSPAFRLDNLLEPSVHESAEATSSDAGYERSLSESHTIEHSTSESSYVFTGKLPTPPFIGHAATASSTHTSISGLGISVSTDLNLGRFAVPDDFERAVLATKGPVTNAVQSSFPRPSNSSETEPNVKHPRKHGPTSHRRKARGVFPQDNVPLAISHNTTKQSRYRPSGDRQPVACGYRDPITQILCDEPFNRSVELRRHVRAVHVPAEALAVTMGQLSRSQATLLPADWKPGDGDVLRPKCLCGKEFSRSDALRRHWTGVQAEVKDGKCIFCPSSLSKKKDHPAFEQPGAESTYGAPLHS